MANYCVFGVTFLLAAILFSRTESYILRAEPLLLEFGTFVAADKTCFFKKIFKGQKSPVTFNFNNPGNTNIDYVKVEVDQLKRTGGMTADIIRGATGSITVSLMVSESSGKRVFGSNAQVTMMCA
ncbi:uncharacterized protein LOC131436602 [Malaya genurostris]|uniref:uncharacterized protein LOC131436602 n=1 Tax=Malaya genurostris TaxID=325434 RepID=UPI0026F38435|nr:uncharacterized protein LOC131436602 [Malaya genurostris]